MKRNSQESSEGLSIGLGDLGSCTGKMVKALCVVGAFTPLRLGY